MTVQPTLSQLSVNNIRFGFENTQPLSHEQIVVNLIVVPFSYTQ